MSKAVMISIQPKWCELIASGKKTIEVRKTKPKIDAPFKCHIYCTSSDIHSGLVVGDNEAKLICCCNYKTGIPVGGEIGNGKVIGEFVCDKIDEFHEWQLHPYGKFAEYEQENLDNFLKATCLTFAEVCTYRENLPYYKPLYGWQISQLKIYDKPKELEEFGTYKHKQKIIDKGCEVIIEDYNEFKPLTRPFQSWGYICSNE